MEVRDTITGAAVAAGISIHHKLGHGLPESVCEAVLARDLGRLGFHVERHKAVSFDEGTRFDDAFRPDLIIKDAVMVKVKAARWTRFERQRSRT